MKNLSKVTLFFVLLNGSVAQAQIHLSALPYTQSFDALGTASGTWTDGSTLTGWYAANNNAGVVTPYTAYTVGSGGGTSSSTLYDLGVSGAEDRALGAAPASTRSTILGLRLLNDTASVFDELQVQYDLEQWSDRGTSQISLSYQKFTAGTGSLSVSSGWTTLGITASPLPSSATPTTGIGNTTGLLAGLTSSLSGLGLQAGEELWIRWDITKVAGNNCTHGIDNVLVVVPEPSAAVLLGLGLIALRQAARARRLA